MGVLQENLKLKHDDKNADVHDDNSTQDGEQRNFPIEKRRGFILCLKYSLTLLVKRHYQDRQLCFLEAVTFRVDSTTTSPQAVNPYLVYRVAPEETSNLGATSYGSVLWP